MGWISNDNEHEGWAAGVVPGGRLSASSSGEGMLIRGITGRYTLDKMLPDYEVVPDSEIIGWRGACECGWQGEMWERVTSPAAANFSRRRHYVSRTSSMLHARSKTPSTTGGRPTSLPRKLSSAWKRQRVNTSGRPPARQDRRSRQGRRGILGRHRPGRGHQPVCPRTVGRQAVTLAQSVIRSAMPSVSRPSVGWCGCAEHRLARTSDSTL